MPSRMVRRIAGKVATTHVTPRRHRRTPSSGITSPLDIGGSNVWLDFSDITTLFKDTARTVAVTADADIILGVTDKSGNGRHFTEATNGPTYKDNIQNSKSVSRFDGTNDILTNTAMSADASRTDIIIAKQATAPDGTQRALLDFADVRIKARNVESATNWVFSHLPVDVAWPNATTNSWHILIVRCNSAASLDLYSDVDSTATSGDPHDNWTTATEGNIGSRGGGLEFMNADVAEYIQYNSALSVADINSIGAFLGTKWAITWTNVT